MFSWSVTLFHITYSMVITHSVALLQLYDDGRRPARELFKRLLGITYISTTYYYNTVVTTLDVTILKRFRGDRLVTADQTI